MRLDGDATLTLEIHRVEDLGLHLAGLERAGELEEAICQRRLAVVDVGDDREITNETLIHQDSGKGNYTAPSMPAPPDAGAEARRVSLASAAGTTIEWYDFFIYGTAAATVFGPQFFPQVSELAGTLAAFATFGIGFVARPLGGVVMGHYGDRLGRKFMLVWSLLLMGGATLAIGLLPTYAQIGVWASVLLVVLRFVQGFALGGEWGGAVLMSVEHAPDGRRGIFGSVVALGLPAGIVLSNLVFLIASTSVDAGEFAAWGWRVPFVASAALVGVGLWVRLGIAESPVFAKALQAHAVRRLPIVDVLRTHGRTVALAAGSYLSISSLGYIVLVYFVTYATRQLGLTLPVTLAIVIVGAIVATPSIVLFAHWSDRFGRRRMMRWGLGLLALWSLIFFPLAETRSVPLITLAVAGMLFIQGMYLGPQPAVFSELFPTSVRYSGASLSLTLASVLGGAVAPIVATTLYGLTGTSRLVTAYMAAVSRASPGCARSGCPKRSGTPCRSAADSSVPRVLPPLPGDVEDYRDDRWGPRRDPAGADADPGGALRRARRLCRVPDRFAAARSVALRGGLRPARRGDAAQRADRPGSVADLAAEGRAHPARPRLLREAGAREGDVPRAAHDSALPRDLGPAAGGRGARLSTPAQAILRVLRREWEMGTADLRDESGVTDRNAFTRAIDELQAAMLVVPSEVLYQPKFTYIWTLGVGRFPDALRAPSRASARSARSRAAF